MIGVSISARREWEYTINHFNLQSDELIEYAFGKYFLKVINNKEVIFYYTGVRKVNAAAANQYMIIKFNLEKVIVAGTCAGIDNNYKVLDIIIPNVTYQYDCTVKEIEPLIKEKYTVKLDLSGLNFEFKTGSIGTADKAVVMWEDFLELKNNNITIADTESAAIAQVCRMNNVKCVIVKGISDFPKDINNNNEQFNEFIDNVPRVMKTIFNNYLSLII